MIEILDDGRYSPLCFTLWNDPDPAPVWLGRGDVVVSVENLRRGDGTWGWRYVILHPVDEEEEEKGGLAR